MNEWLYYIICGMVICCIPGIVYLAYEWIKLD